MWLANMRIVREYLSSDAKRGGSDHGSVNANEKRYKEREREKKDERMDRLNA